MKKLVYILLAFCILNMVYCCTSTRELSVALADFYSKDFDYITVHATNTIFELHEFEFSYLTLEGIIKDKKNIDYKSYHIYVDAIIDASSSKHVVIERKNIKKATYVTGKVPDAIYISIVIIFCIASFWALSNFPL